MYQQHDRESKNERIEKKLEPDYSAMIRWRIPGGQLSAKQLIAFDDAADTYGQGHYKITTRQAVQIHGVAKHHISLLLQFLYTHAIDSIAACGDVNRNVLCSPFSQQSALYEQVAPYAHQLSEMLLPQTTAWHDIWINGKKYAEPITQDIEPLYGSQYLPRKFKSAIVIPPYNDTDIYANDLGFIAIAEDKQLLGFNLLVGGGLGITHGMPNTYPRTASVIGFITPDKLLSAGQAVLAIQRDYGDRTDRKQARLKYTLDDLGVARFTEDLQKRMNTSIAPAREYQFIHNGDLFGWHKSDDGSYFLVVHTVHGRIADTMKQALRAVAETHTGQFRLTANQNIIIANVRSADKKIINRIFAQHDIDPQRKDLSVAAKQSLACVALPTCSLAMAEGERYLPQFLSLLEPTLQQLNLTQEHISIRMTGCPNGCARPFLSDIAFVGKALGRYNMYLGGASDGSRVNRLYKENITTDDMLAHTIDALTLFASHRNKHEPFGDYALRALVVHNTPSN